MRTTLFFTLSIGIVLAVTSCKKELQPQDSSNAIRATDNVANKEASNQAVPSISPNQTQNNSSNTTHGLNPAHGQPGHRCDIAVGKPLNTPIGNTNVQPVTTQSIQSAGKVVNVQPTITPKGMNPPHGQPGHRCDISVGQPLNSKPNVAANQTANSTTITTNVDTTPKNETPTQGTITTTQEVIPQTNPATPVAPGMNPPHGQEGHVCSIAVGQPLPKK